jgi:hypothetical protein
MSSSSDPHEREADRIAEIVARGGTVAGMISQKSGAAVSRDVFDITIGVGLGPGPAEAARQVAAEATKVPIIHDILASIAESPAHFEKLVTEVLKDHWYEFLQTMATLVAA